MTLKYLLPAAGAALLLVACADDGPYVQPEREPSMVESPYAFEEAREADLSPTDEPFLVWAQTDVAAQTSDVVTTIYPAEDHFGHGEVRFREIDGRVYMRTYLEGLEPNTVFTLLLGPREDLIAAITSPTAPEVAEEGAPEGDEALEEGDAVVGAPDQAPQAVLLGFLSSEADGSAYGEFALDPNWELAKGEEGVMGRSFIVTTIDRLSAGDSTTVEAGAPRQQDAQEGVRVHLGDIVGAGFVGR